MDETIAEYVPRIRAIQPDLIIEHIAYNGEGLVNDVLVVNGEFVYRFARDGQGVTILARCAGPRVSSADATPGRVGRAPVRRCSGGCG